MEREVAKVTNSYRAWELVSNNSNKSKEELVIMVHKTLNEIPGNHITTSNAACYVWNAMKKIKNGIKPKPTRERKEKIKIDVPDEVRALKRATPVIPDASIEEMDKRFVAWNKGMKGFEPPRFLMR